MWSVWRFLDRLTLAVMKITTKQYELTTLIVGAGAVENAWKPVISAFGVDSAVKTPDQANFTLARIVYLMRFAANNNLDDSRDDIKTFKKDMRLIKEAIGYELVEAENQNLIRARPELENILLQHVLVDTKNLMLINVNWDKVIEHEIEQIMSRRAPNFKLHPIHIHGSTDSTANLYLPSEIVNEPYRSEEERKELGEYHAASLAAVEAANRIVLYGLSLDPLDAELNSILYSGCFEENTREIIVINPDHENVCNRLLTMIQIGHKLKVYGVDPGNLTERKEYR